MMLQSALILSLVTASFASPIILRSDGDGPPPNSTFIPCYKGTTDPICQLVRHPNKDIITTIVHHNGTVETKRNLYTREQLKAIREQNNVTSIEYKPGEVPHNGAEEFISRMMKRETAPQVCRTETQRWYDQNNWGYWFQSWQQVGSCFYCDQCTDAIATAFAVAETWTFGLNVKFNEVITATFGFQQAQTYTLTETRTCNWNWVENGCHSIWYQPLMSYHNGYANYQTHVHCDGTIFNPASDGYYDHNWAWANVNQAGNNGVNQGNMGCNSGCQGSDKRQCQHANNGGVLWSYAN